MTEGKTLWRVFCAVDLPDELKWRIGLRAARLRKAFPRVPASWVRPRTLHLTLKFIGETEPARVADLSAAAARAAQSCGPFELTMNEAGRFPPRGPARVLWLGVRDDTGGLARLHGRLEDECAAAGFERDTRAYNPHLTVARLRNPHISHDIAALHCATLVRPQTFRVDKFLVMRSELGQRGALYTPLSRHELGTA